MANFDISLVTEKAEDLAKDFVNKRITATQIRKFYNEFKDMQRKYQTRNSNGNNKEEAFISILPQLKIMIAKVSYASARQNVTIPDCFIDWIKEWVLKIENSQNFEDFLLHFEAVLGFTVAYQKKKENAQNSHNNSFCQKNHYVNKNNRK